MINPKELRIDNWVWKTKIGLCQILGIELTSDPDRTKVWVWREGMEFRHQALLKELTAVSITPEILEKNCGFKKYNGCYVLKTKSCNISFDGDTFLIYDKDFDKGSGVIIPNDRSQYLHQLQNLYYALIGRELEIKELV